MHKDVNPAPSKYYNFSTRIFLELCLCKFIKNKKGHVQYTRSDLTRPLTFQNHIDPVPEFIVQNLLRGLGYSKMEFFEILYNKKIVVAVGNKYHIISAT